MSLQDIALSSNVETELDAAIDKLTRGAGLLEPTITAARGAAPAPLAFHRVLVALDGGPSMPHALAWAEHLARMSDARVWLLHVAPSPEMMTHTLGYMGAMGWAPAPLDASNARDRSVAIMLARSVAHLEHAGVQAQMDMRVGPTVEAIVANAAEHDADLVVLGSHGRGAVGRALLGSVADGVKNHVSASVLIARTAPPPRRILVGTDGSRASKRAAAIGLRLSSAWRAPAEVLHVVDPLDAAEEEDLARLRAHAFGDLAFAWTQPKAAFGLDVGNPAARLLQSAEGHGVDLVVLGSRGLSGLRSLVAGSVSNRVAHDAKASVLLVKEASP